MTEQQQPENPPVEIDVTVPHSARIWNYWLGGKDNYAIDREVGEQIQKFQPELPQIARIARGFIGRSVRFLAGEAGISQFLDVGTGLPTVDNTHEVAQRVNPAARIVYVDNDPLVLAHARALLTSTPEGFTTFVNADVCEPEKILERAEAHLDFDQPIGLMLMGILGHIVPYEKALEIATTLVGALPSGSYLGLYDGDDTDAVAVEAMRKYAQSGAVPYNLRPPGQIAAYFTGLDLVEPGFVAPHRWRPDAADGDVGNGEVAAAGRAGVGRKP